MFNVNRLLPKMGIVVHYKSAANCCQVILENQISFTLIIPKWFEWFKNNRIYIELKIDLNLDLKCHCFGEYSTEIGINICQLLIMPDFKYKISCIYAFTTTTTAKCV